MPVPFFVVPQPTVRSAYLGPVRANTKVLYSGFIYFDPELTGSGADWELETLQFDLPGAGGPDLFPISSVRQVSAIAFPMVISNDGHAVDAGWGVHVKAYAQAGRLRVSIDVVPPARSSVSTAS